MSDLYLSVRLPHHACKIVQIEIVQNRLIAKRLPGLKDATSKDWLEKRGLKNPELRRLRQYFVFTLNVS